MLSNAASGKCSGWGVLRACLWRFHGVLYFSHTESHGNRKPACLSGKHGRCVSWCLSVSKNQEAFACLSWRSGWNRADRRAALLSGSRRSSWEKRWLCSSLWLHFFMSTLAGTLLAAILLAMLRRLGLFSYFERLINE
jgi:hypothetical protein